MYEGFACLAGVELVNSTRTAAYSGHAGAISVTCTGGPWFRPSLGDEPYVSPQADPAPWFDEAVPDSRYFYGLVGIEVDGAMDGTSASAWTDFLTDGASPGPLRRAARDVQITAIAIAETDTALSYGIGWLASALRGSACRPACTGDDLLMYAGMPAPEPVLSSGACHELQPAPAGAAPVSVDPWRTRQWGTTPGERGDQVARTLHNVVLLEGPTVSDRTCVPSGCMATVQFTLRAGWPQWCLTPTQVWPQPGQQPYTDVLRGYDPDSVWQQCRDAERAQNCIEDPDLNHRLPGCADVHPPPVPEPPKDPCYPSGPYSLARRTIVKIPPAAAAAWFDKVPVVRIETGSTPILRLLLRWYANPQQRDPSADLNPCTACAQTVIAYLPPKATLTIDGRTQQATVECVGNRYATPVLYGPNGGPYTWPVFDCTTSMFLEIMVDGTVPQPTDGTRSMQVFLVARTGAA